MKPKNKTLALVEIAIVLCSILLVALPSIAAEQNQEMQKASASTSTITTTASEDDDTFTLGIYGNANEDDTIDMRDTTYIKLAIFGKKPKTDFADANCDGKVSMLDVGQTKLIILGKEKSLTVLDTPEESKGRLPEAVTIHKPVERVVVASGSEAEALRILDAADTIVGVSESIKTSEVYFQEFTEVPSIGTGGYGAGAVDYEAILNIHPDIYFGRPSGDKDKLPSIAVMSTDVSDAMKSPRALRKLGYLFDRREEANEYSNWHDDVINMFQGRIESEIPDINDRPQVLYCKEKGNQIKIYINSGGSEVLEMTLCSNVGYELPEELKVTHPTVDIEWLLELDPEVIIIGAAAVPYKCGYPVDDYSEIATAREGIMNNPVWARNTAVKEGKVYVTASGSLTYSPSYIVGASYYVKWIYPDLFEDFDPVAIHQEYVDFQGIDFDVREHGVFVYPPM